MLGLNQSWQLIVIAIPYDSCQPVHPEHFSIFSGEIEGWMNNKCVMFRQYEHYHANVLLTMHNLGEMTLSTRTGHTTLGASNIQAILELQ